MIGLFSSVQIGKKNILVGVFLFLISAVVIGIPLTLNFFGVPVLSAEQYQLWKVVHGYSIFLGAINFFLGVTVDQLGISSQRKEILSWSFVLAGLFGGVVRMILVLLAIYADWHLLASLGEVIFFSVGLAIFVYGWAKEKNLVHA